MADADIYAGIHVHPEKVAVQFGRRSRNAVGQHDQPLGIERLGLKDNFQIEVGDASLQAVIDRAAEEIPKSVGSVRRVTVSSFGPLVSVQPGAKGFGTISDTSSHENGRGVDVVGPFKRLNGRDTRMPLRLVTDVTAGAIGEWYARSAQTGERYSLAYLYLGAGIGGGYASQSIPWQGAHHPEVGFVPVQVTRSDAWAEAKRIAAADRGETLFLQDVLSIPALVERTGIDIDTLMQDARNSVWDTHAHYIAQLCSIVTTMLAVHQIVLDGPIMATPGLLNKVREQFHDRMKRQGEIYHAYPQMEVAEEFLQPPSTNRSILNGAMYFAAAPDTVVRTVPKIAENT